MPLGIGRLVGSTFVALQILFVFLTNKFPATSHRTGFRFRPKARSVLWNPCAEADSKHEHMKFKTWKIIKVGTGLRTVVDFTAALQRSGCSIGHFWTDTLLKSMVLKLATKETKIALVKISPRQLRRFEPESRHSPVRLDDAYERAMMMGLRLCPAEVGAQLRLQYLDQPPNSHLLIAMQSVVTRPGPDWHRREHSFYLCHDKNNCWLAARETNYHSLLYPDLVELVFAKSESEYAEPNFDPTITKSGHFLAGLQRNDYAL